MQECFLRDSACFSKSAFKRAACPKAQSCRKFLPAPSSSVACYVLIPLFLLLFISFFPHLNRDSVCALSLEGEEGWSLFSLTLSNEKTKVRENPLRSPEQAQGLDKYLKNHYFSTVFPHRILQKRWGKICIAFRFSIGEFHTRPWGQRLDNESGRRKKIGRGQVLWARQNKKWDTHGDFPEQCIILWEKKWKGKGEAAAWIFFFKKPARHILLRWTLLLCLPRSDAQKGAANTQRRKRKKKDMGNKRWSKQKKEEFAKPLPLWRRNGKRKRGRGAIFMACRSVGPFAEDLKWKKGQLHDLIPRVLKSRRP